MSPLENQTRLDASLDSILKKQEAVMELFINSKPFLLEAMKLREAAEDLVELAVLWHGRETNGPMKDQTHNLGGAVTENSSKRTPHHDTHAD